MRSCMPGGVRSKSALTQGEFTPQASVPLFFGAVFMQSRMNEGRHPVRGSRSRNYVTTLDLSLFPVILSDSWHNGCSPGARQHHRKHQRFRAEFHLRELRRLERDLA